MIKDIDRLLSKPDSLTLGLLFLGGSIGLLFGLIAPLHQLIMHTL